MTRPLSDNSVERELGRHSWGLQRQEFTPLAFRWRTPMIDEPPPLGVVPELENGWAQVDPPLERFAYRLHTDGSLEFKGHLDASGASSGTVAITLPDAVTDPDLFPEPSYLLPRDQFWHTVITDDGGTSFQIALVKIDSVTGEVTITWPAS